MPAVRIAFDRPEVRNAFRPHTVDELYRALDHARHVVRRRRACCSPATARPPKDGGWAFCSGGDQRIRGRAGYQYAEGETADDRRPGAQPGRLHILEVQRLIRFMPKVVIALVNGWAAGGGHSLHVVCDLTLASRRARPVQADRRRRRLASTRGYGSAYLARQVGQKFAREIFFLGRDLRRRATRTRWARSTASSRTPSSRPSAWSGRATICGKSPTAQRMLKYAFNAIDDGLVGQQVFAGEATRLAYMTDEAVEGRDAFLEKRDPDWSRVPVLLLTEVPAGRSQRLCSG